MEIAKIVFQMYNTAFRKISEGASHHTSVLLCQFIPIKTTFKVEMYAALENNCHIGIFP